MRYVWMDRVRGLAILAVVGMHAELQAVACGGPLPLVHALNGLLGPVRMPLLVALSGVLLTPALAKGPRRYLTGKVRSLLWPYLVWVTLDTVYAALRGAPVGRDYVLHLAYDPQTYLWFLAYLFAFYVLALGLTEEVRTVCGPLSLVAALQLDPSGSLHKAAWLFGWFLVGDLVGRLLRGRLRATTVTSYDVLALVGRNSLAFYASHMLVAIVVTRLAVWSGVREVHVLFTLAVSSMLGAGWGLVAARRYPWVDALFVMPRRRPRPVREVAPSLGCAP